MTHEDVIQLYWSRRKQRLRPRAVPRTAENPTPAQVETRIRFGEAAQQAHGLHRQEGDRLLPAQQAVRDALKDTESPLKKEKPIPKWKRVLMDHLRKRKPNISEQDAEEQVEVVDAMLEG